MPVKDEICTIALPYFGEERENRTVERAVPVKKIETTAGPRYVTTIYDLVLANYGIDRGLGGEAAASYEDDTPYTPKWQERYTIVARMSRQKSIKFLMNQAAAFAASSSMAG